MSSGVSGKLVSLSKVHHRFFTSNENKWISLTNFAGRAMGLSTDRHARHLYTDEGDKPITKTIHDILFNVNSYNPRVVTGE
jgi:hypothetical protein